MVFEGHRDQSERVRPVISTVFGLGVASAPGGAADEPAIRAGQLASE